MSPVARVAQPLVPADYRSISVASVPCQLFEEMIIKQFVYPAIATQRSSVEIKTLFDQLDLLGLPLLPHYPVPLACL